MNLGPYEDHLLRALRQRLGDAADLAAGPPACGPATGLRAQVFVHAAAYRDGGGATPDGARVARQPVTLAGGASGFVEPRPGSVEIEVTCVCARHDQAQALAGLVAPALLEALETLAPPLLSDPADGHRQLRLADQRAHVHAQHSQRLVHEGVAAAQAVLTLRVEGFLHLLLAREGGLVRRSAFELPLRLQVCADPAGRDVQQEHLLLHNDSGSALELGGWMVRDAARRPHAYTFAAARRLGAGATLRLWSGRGEDDAANVYWGRRQAVWNNTGDVALLLDPDGVERARAEWSPPLPAVAPSAAAPAAPRRRR